MRRPGVTDVLAVVIVLGEWTGLARALIGAPIYAAVLDLVAVLLLAYVLLVERGAIWHKLRRPLALLLIAYVALSAIEMLNPNVPRLAVGLEGFRKTAFTAIAFFIVYLSRTGDAGRFFRLVAVGSIPAFLVAVRQFVAPSALELQIVAGSGVNSITFHSGEVLRAFSPTAGPFHLGMLASFVCLIALAEARAGAARAGTARAPWSTWGWVAMAGFAAAVLGLTITRANMAALAVAIAVMIVASPLGGRIRAVVQAAPSGLALALAVLIGAGALQLPSLGIGGPAPSPGVEGEHPSLDEVVDGLVNPLGDKNLQLRFSYWRDFAAAIAERPIIGYGTSAAADGFDRLYAGTSSRNFEPHSIYFKAALEMGLVGLLLLLAILGVATLTALRRLRSEALLGVTTLGIIAVIAVSGVTGPMLDAYPINALFWASLGWLARPPGSPTPVEPISLPAGAP